MLLRISDLRKYYDTGEDRIDVLRGVNLSLAAGDTLALEGESGSGKSTVLHLIAGLDTASGGSIQVAGTEMTGLSDQKAARMRRGTIGVIFQQFNLIPSLDVAANIAFHARLSGRFDEALTHKLADRIGLSDHLNKFPETLSGGQQQRVAIARALATRPGIILADEPTGNLDEGTADSVLELMLECAAEAGSAVLMVTHSARQASRMGRRLTLRHGVVGDRAGPGSQL